MSHYICAMQIRWMVKNFEDLTAAELYMILQLRNQVFVVEQKCIFQDADDKDQESFHLMGFAEKRLVAYARIVRPGISYSEASIGRVVTAPSVRGNGTGKVLLQQSIRTLYDLLGRQPIKLGAQLYLKHFYESFGFRQIGDIYDEDGIDHIYMLKE